MKFFGVKEFFIITSDFKNGCKNEFKHNNEKSADLEIGFLRKSVWKPNSRATAMPTAWELSCLIYNYNLKIQEHL